MNLSLLAGRYGGRKALRNEFAKFEALTMAARKIVDIVVTIGAQSLGGLAIAAFERP